MLTEGERSQIEQRLLRERADVLELLEQFDAESQDLRERAGELSIYDQHQADYATESQEQEKSFALTSLEGQRLYQIDAALRRLYQEPERFGICEKCGREIGFARLEVIPETTLCAEHAAAADAAAGVDANPREADPDADPVTPDPGAKPVQTDRHR